MSTIVPLMVGICGGSWGDGGVGKTTVANILSKHLDFYPLSFVDPVKDVAKRFFGWNGEMKDEALILLDRICRTGRSISENYWCDLTMMRIPNGQESVKVVLDDVWFPNEVKAITSNGGLIIRVTKQGHASPSLPCETLELSNNDTLLSLQHRAILLLTAAIAEKY